MISLRWAKPKDVESIARINARCFPTSDSTDRAERIRNDARCNISDILVAEENGRIVGSTTLIPQKVWTGGTEHAQGGVAAVQVDPDFRRRGLGHVLMKRIDQAHRERGFPLSMLHPYSPVFYRRLGYAPIERWIELRLRAAALPECEAAMSVRTATGDDLEAVIECHRRSLPSHNGGMTRSPQVWMQRIFGGRRMVAIFERDRQVDGYFIYELHPTHDVLQQLMYVREWVAPDDEVARALFGYLAAQKAQCPEVRLFAPVDCPLMLFLSEPRSLAYENPQDGHYSSGTMGTSAMARVVDLARLFAAGRRLAGPPLACRFRLIETRGAPVGDAGDASVEEVGVEFDGSTAQLTRQSPSAWLECDPGTMAQVYFGAVGPREAVRWGAARADSVETLEKLEVLFAQSAPFVHPLDFF